MTAGKDRTGKAAREKRILDAAVRLMLRWGFRKTTIDDVARESEVGKGTIYLHWKDKKELFRAALWRASGQAAEDTLRRVQADPDGGQFHRFFAHGMVAVYANPLLAALMSGKHDIFKGLIGTLSPATLNQIAGTSTEQIAKLQAAGLVRKDISLNVVVFLIGALKTGLITSSEYTPQDQMPSIEQITESLSDLIRRWLVPPDGPDSGELGKQIVSQWMEAVMHLSASDRHTEE